MVIFPGQYVQSTWKPNMEANSENYPWIYGNKSGWMDSQTFFKWFEQFEEKTRYFEEVGIGFFFILKILHQFTILSLNIGQFK